MCSLVAGHFSFSFRISHLVVVSLLPPPSLFVVVDVVELMHGCKSWLIVQCVCVGGFGQARAEQGGRRCSLSSEEHHKRVPSQLEGVTARIHVLCLGGGEMSQHLFGPTLS